jgi:glycosyltransferase involved in cell wall biosynthesis
MEAMVNGCAIIATPVGDIPYHVKNNANGFLVSSIDDESTIIKEGCEKILWLKNNADDWKKISENNIRYASEHFSIEQFNMAYRNLLNKP